MYSIRHLFVYDFQIFSIRIRTSLRWPISYATFTQQSQHLLYSTIILEMMRDILERKFLSTNKRRKGTKPRVNTNVTRLEAVSSKMSSRNRLVQSGKPTDWHVMSTDPEVRKRKGGLFSCARLEFLRDSSAFAKGPGMGTRVPVCSSRFHTTNDPPTEWLSRISCRALASPLWILDFQIDGLHDLHRSLCNDHDGWIIFAKIRRICLITGWDA